MPDTTFETLLSSQLRAYAEAGVRPIDRFAIAEETIAAGRTMPRWRRSRGLAPTRGNRFLMPLLVGLLLAALMGGALVAGGRLVAPSPLPRQDTIRNELVSLPDLPRPMEYPQVVPLLDGRILVIGGTGSGGGPRTTALLYDLATGRSDPLDPIATPRGFVDSAIRLKDGRVLILADGAASIFDPTTLQVAPVGPMVVPRRAATALLHDGRVLLAGGMTPGGGEKTGLLSAELFDPETLTFSATGSMATTAGDLATLPDGRVFVASDGGDVAQVYDPATGLFGLAGRPSSAAGGMPIVLPDGRVVLFASTGMKRRLLTEVWDPASRTFSKLEDPPGQVLSATMLDDGRIFLMGGQDPAWAGIYDPATGVTSRIQTPRAWLPTAARLPDGRVLLVGGLEDGGAHTDPNGGCCLDAPAVRTVQVLQ